MSETEQRCDALPCGDHGACTCYGDNLMRVGRENERKRIVAWLRSEADEWDVLLATLLLAELRATATAIRDELRDKATAIENGAHHEQ